MFLQENQDASKIGPVLVVDYSWLYRRSYHTFTDLCVDRVRDGIPKRIFTGSMFGVISHLGQLMVRYNCPVYIAIEPKHNRRRYELKPEYKGNRDKSDPALPAIFELYHETLNALALYRDVHIITAPDICDGEADDVIHSFMLDHHKIFSKFLVFSNDKDLMQSAKDPNLKDKVFYVSVGDPGEVSFEKRCMDDFGVSPENVLLYRAIVGDSSDNLKAPVQRFNRDLARAIATTVKTPDQIWNKFMLENPPVKKTYQEWMVKLAGQKDKLTINYEVMTLQHVLYEKREYKREDRNIGYFWMEYGMNEFMKLYEARNNKTPQVSVV
jgi:5'-3' exonuclease